MKKVNWIFLLGMIVSLGFFTSCDENEGEDITVNTDTVKVYSAKLLFAPTSDSTSLTFFKYSTGATVAVTDFQANSADIDFGYFYGNTAKAALASPSDYLTTAYDLAALYPNATRNVTTFASTTVVYADVVTGAAIEAAYTNGTLSTDGNSNAATRIYNLKDGDVVAFKTAAGEYGLIKINAVVDADNDGLYYGDEDYMSIEVKVADEIVAE